MRFGGVVGPYETIHTLKAGFRLTFGSENVNEVSMIITLEKKLEFSARK
jgi:hypothetical protein